MVGVQAAFARSTWWMTCRTNQPFPATKNHPDQASFSFRDHGHHFILTQPQPIYFNRMYSQLPVLFQSISIQGGLITSLQPTFPMQNIPRCRRCDYQPKYRSTVTPNNPNSNAGRPYYFCIKCHFSRECWAANDGRRKGWISWDDGRGVHRSNHNCDCGVACRQDRAGINSSHPGRGFWTCASGYCSYTSFRRDGLTDDEARNAEVALDARFEPWLV